MMIIKSVKAVALLLAVALLNTGDAAAMTIREALEYAMEHNRDILAAGQNIVEREGQVIEARSEAFPQLNLAMNGFRVRDPGFLNSTFGQELLKGGGGGGGNDLGIPIEAILPKPQTFYDMTLNFSQPLFTWGKVGNAMKVAKLGRREMDLALSDIRRQVAYDVTSAYYDILLAEESIEIYKQAIETQQRYLKQTRDFFEVGDGTRLQVLRAESQLARTQPDLLAAENELDQSSKRLNFLLGRDLDAVLSNIELAQEDDFMVPALDSVSGVAASLRPDLKAMDVSVQFYDKTINVFKADFRPRADLRGYYGFSTINTDDLLDRNFESWRVALEISIPVFDGLRNRGVVKQYTAIRDRRRIERSRLDESIRLESRQVIDAVRNTRHIYDARIRELTSSGEEERVARDQFEQSLITMYELMDSHRRAIEARTGMLVARYNYLRKIAELKKVMGVPVKDLF
jgi:outer membrane protein TolC